MWILYYTGFPDGFLFLGYVTCKIQVITQNFLDKQFPLYHKPSRIVLNKILDPYNKLTPKKRFHEINLLRKEIDNINELSDRLSIEINNVKNKRATYSDIYSIFNEFSNLLHGGRADTISAFYSVFLLDCDYSLQTRNSKYSKKYLEYPRSIEDVDNDSEISKGIRLTEKLINLGKRLYESSKVNVQAASRYINKPEFYILRKGKPEDNPLTKFGYGCFCFEPDELYDFKRIEIFKTLKPDMNKKLSGLNFFEDGSINFYFLKNCSISDSIEVLRATIPPYDDEKVVMFGVNRNGKLKTSEFIYHDTINFFETLGDDKFRTIQIEYSSYIFTFEEESNFRPPYISIRSNNSLPENTINFYAKLNPIIPIDLMLMLLENENII